MSYIYVLFNPSIPGSVKIGMTSRSPYTRAAELSTTGVPKPFEVADFWSVDPDKLREIEQEIHKSLSRKRDSLNREFFKLTVDQARDYIENYLRDKTQLETLRQELEKSKDARLREKEELLKEKKELVDLISRHIELIFRRINERLSAKYEKPELFNLLDKFWIKNQLKPIKKRGNAWWSVVFQPHKRPSLTISLRYSNKKAFFSGEIKQWMPIWITYDVISGKTKKQQFGPSFAEYINLPDTLYNLLIYLGMFDDAVRYEELQDKINNIVTAKITHSEEQVCPSCHEGTLILRSRRKDNHQFLGCSSYPKCKFTANIRH